MADATAEALFSSVYGVLQPPPPWPVGIFRVRLTLGGQGLTGLFHRRNVSGIAV